LTSDEIISVLRENESALRARGVSHAALFGSHARGDARPGSDIDIMIEIAPDAVRDIEGLHRGAFQRANSCR